MLAKLEAQYIQAFLAYKSADGTLGVTGTTAGVTFKNGLYVGGTFSASALPITTDNITISGAAGNGYIQYGAQTAAPSLALVHTYADAGGHFAIGQSGSSGKTISFTNGLMTADRDYAFQNKSGTLAMTNDNLSQFTNDTGFVAGPGSAVSGRLPSFNGTTGKLLQDSGINLAGTSGKTLTVSNSIGLAGVDGKVLTLNQNLNLDGTSGKSLTLTGGLTIGADASITGGGTLALAGFTLTVPATGTAVLTSRTLTEGAGLAGNTYDLSANRSLAMGTPGTLSITSTNAVSGTTHSHVITASSNPGAAASLLASDGSGFLTLPRFTATGYMFVNALTANLYLKDTSTGFQAAATGIVTPQSGNAFRTTGFTSGVAGWNQSNNGDAEFNNVRIRGELAASVFKVSEISSTAGTFGVFYSAAALNADCITPASTSSSFTFDAKNSDAGGMLFAVNDVVRLKSWTGAAVSDSWATLTARTNHSTYTTYTATLNSGSTSATFRAGTAVVDYGPSGTGFITLSTDGTVGSSPNLTMATHAGSPWSAFNTLLRLGNLNGSYDYASNIYGLAVGDYSSGSWLAADSSSGVRIVSGGGNVRLDSGGLSFLSSTTGTSATSVTWLTAGSPTSLLTNIYSGTDNRLVFAASTKTNLSSEDSMVRIETRTGPTNLSGVFALRAQASTAKSWAGFGPGVDYTFAGVTINGFSATTAPTHMLEVYGTGWFESGLALRDTSAAFDVALSVTSSTALTAARALTIDVGNTSPTLSFGAWTTYTPTVTTTSGTITTLGTVTGRYKTIGKTVYIQVSVSITTNGTGAGAVDITLPVNARASTAYILNGKETNAVGFACTAAIQTSDSTKLRVAKYDTTYPGSNGAILVVTGVYESA